jgi:hypothetical protein
MRRRVLSLKAWGSLCKPKEMGGLGLRRMREVNLALISKLGWNLLNNTDLMWVSQLHCKYLSSCSFLSPSSLSSSSWLWKVILKSIPFISKGAYNRIHSFSFLPIWSSTWIPSISSFTPSPSPWFTQPFPNLLVSDLFYSDPVLTTPAWNLPLLNYLFDETTIREVLKINFSHVSQNKFIWTPSTNDLFSTKSAHRMISS